MNPTLHTLLDANLQLPPEYRAGLSNHLPMALHALAELKAPPQRLHAFFDHYVQRFGEAPRPVQASEAEHWPALRGRIQAFESLRCGFARQLQRQGLDATLHAALPLLWPGVAAAAFHGLIRTAHALQSGHPGEITAGLAYWAARWQPLDPPQGQALERAAPLPIALWTQQLEAALGGAHATGGLISQRMDEVRGAAPFIALAGRLDLGPQTLQHLSAWAARHYAASGDFTVLHMVTGCRAARVVTSRAGGDPRPALHALVPAFTAAALASRLGTATPPPAAPERAWADIRAAAVESDDDHVIKLVHACVEEAALYGDGPYLEAAARAVA